MKRRSFFGLLVGAAALPYVPKVALAAPVTPANTPLIVGGAISAAKITPLAVSALKINLNSRCGQLGQGIMRVEGSKLITEYEDGSTLEMVMHK